MNLTVFSKRDLEEILGIIHDSTLCRSEPELMSLMVRVRDIVEADRSICGIGDKSGRMKILNESFPADWMQRYQDEVLSVSDPVVNYVMTFFKTCLWKDAVEVFPGKPYTELMGKASEHGLKYGVAGGVNGKTQNFGSVFSFSSVSDRFGGRQKKILDVVVPHLHQAIMRIASPGISKEKEIEPVVLSVREVEVLRWIKEGKTNWEISMILNISERTVKFHVHNITIKLNAVNKSHAIAIAMERGLLE
ncbi:MAG: LuxR C-terminal-related transcriptional regulator [Deltaproteobacteria bacterium]